MTAGTAQQTPASASDDEVVADGVLRRIARQLAPYKRQMILVGLVVLLAAALTSVAPFLTRAIFDDALFPVDGGPVDLTLLWWLVAGLIVIPIVTALLGIGQNYLTSRIGNSAMADLRSDLFAHLQRMELAFFTGTKTGAIQSRLANDVSGVRTVLTDTATTILQNSVTVIAAFIAMVVLSWQLTILTLILMPLFLVVQVRVGRRRQRIARRTQESLSEMTAITEESLSVSGILLAKVFGRGHAETERYREENRNQTRLQIEAAMTGRTFFALVQTFFAVTPALIYLVAGYLMTGRIGGGEVLTAGTLVAFTTLQARLQMPLMQLMRVTLDVQTSLALFRRIFEYFDLVPAIVERPDARPLERTQHGGRVEFDDVWFRYPEARELSGGRVGPRFGTAAPQDAGGRRGRSATDEPLIPAREWTLSGISLEHRARPAGRDRRTVRLGQDHHDLPGAAVLRRRPRSHPDRRARRPRRHLRLAGPVRRHGHPGAVPVPRLAVRQHRVREGRRHPGRGRAGGPRRQHPRPDHELRAGVRHGGR